MKDGFVNVSARSLPIHLADPKTNVKTIIDAIKEAEEQQLQVLCLQELGLTGATCGDLFTQKALQNAVLSAFSQLLEETSDTAVLTVVGLPLVLAGRLYNCAAAIQSGRILAVVPQTCAKAPFCPAPEAVTDVTILGQTVPFGTELLLACATLPELKIAIEIGTDAFAPISPAACAAVCGATLICRPACDAIMTDSTEEDLVEESLKAQSRRLKCAYLSASAGDGESTTDFAFTGDTWLFENGESQPETVDTELLSHLRGDEFNGEMLEIPFTLEEKDVFITREYSRYPLCGDPAVMLKAQVKGLARRIEAAHVKTLVLGLSGGLDSTVALMAAVHTMQYLERPVTDILAISMPCFGTSSRTKSNAQKLAEAYGVRFKEIPIGDAVSGHFKDIGLSPDDRSTTYENAQARERTQILMDVSGMEGGMVLGTGDISELALGWCTYNGDHMSMYAVNAGITKTALQEMVREEMFMTENAELSAVLADILDTPISPELLPPSDDEIAQKTEDLVGPYELHDFFLYHMLHSGFSPRKIYRIACHVWTEGEFEGDSVYDEKTVLHWLKTFVRRFFIQQFKRSCMPDGVAVTDVSLSPRAGFQMPSDANFNAWLAELDEV